MEYVHPLLCYDDGVVATAVAFALKVDMPEISDDDAPPALPDVASCDGVFVPK